ncbi:uncharacterized protein LOC100829905 [Brachypodium distachyon]|uniref:Uncharacterized protein n=1 Tax=Brachypodium distachyon TaxID=15368 RepID=I1HQN5_BRADI|nr:uncharacterized protein LOC100829905 [Brachypodium distachyon]XP_010232188.1 uncharacterized protein LOC100829905 [Brachypodium distachyon]XP_010232189.1 uncharacterized protein LOC100829905 [Brachypodium distachyon]XP_014754482.1 uncharacterized protein LOC100829905 [Brachypodium distachyon]XP_014754483.1 uncharacterized protein LOC100829905 [Brachypodium distachyon]XP_024315358.1 uncharacterized protein LOC100829905 [Brachypodium distachyon]XP_024315359.1 uncharacterized protein LOC10082|eukprot:XP_003569620.1 uncharacterized protein LOC100829905 [Brachypodium distachyon]
MAFASFLVAPPFPPPPAAAAWWRRARERPRCLVASSRGGDPAPPTFERLREQLLQLHAEADLTQSKANSSRVRLVRLTQAAENLKKRAVVSVRIGRENEAVDLLVQKKKLTKALENIKERIELLDKLSAKISEAISVKQNMLIEHALHSGMPRGEESSEEIRVFSGEVDGGAGETSYYVPKSVERQSSEMKSVVYSNLAVQSEQSELQMADSSIISQDSAPPNSIKDCSAYDDFVQHIGSQLNSLEYEIEQYISLQQTEEVDIQQSINGKWNKLSAILKLITETRERIEKISETTLSETGSDGLR